ncbi:PaaX family transcriptional regulator C-terminal domain-containing protein [Pelagicoccus mobilis]|uniref:PaaX-like C-terminal domain-containing protein n=1 Tax=Pelagicoccus mobilis TaxID=415221 RepID=A0A934S145_9BACT|nr:PaaX family transcriptional regulator C-terminal domain-containing protein [Pelagicoccus mobilis]MBK1879089.1 hypothetical protein [Pelagicoccus mobilis]
MRLGWRTKAILESLLIGTVDTLEMITHLRSSRPHYAGYSSDSEARRHLLRLEREGLIQIERRNAQSEWIARLTQQGREAVCDAIDPETEWAAPWEGTWSTITFDIPACQRNKRTELDLWLKKRRFGHMQGSVWVSHRTNPDILEDLRNLKVSLSSLAIFQGYIVSALSDAELARKVWNFDQINANYRKYLDHLNSRSSDHDSPTNKRWFQVESQLWKTAFEADPFLTEHLLPSPYLGKTAFARRKTLFANASKQ